MANLLGKPFRKYVNDTVTSRQITSGIKENRSLEVISALNSRNAWIKFASAVFIDQNRLNILNQSYEGGNPLLEGITPGLDLSLNYVLQGGLVSKGNVSPGASGEIFNAFSGSDEASFRELVRNNTKFKTTHRSGILGYQSNPAYGVGGIEFGYSPMPGITDMELTDLSRGSIKKSTLNIKCHNRAQFDIIDVLYLRLGYTVCLEWGWNHYLEIDASGNETLNYTGDTLIDNEFWKVTNEDYSVFLDKIENKRKETKGNYDGIIGVVSNFSWNFQPDGTYDIRLEITSLGDVIESLKVNLPPLIKSKRDPYAEQRLESIKKDLEDDYASQYDFYNTLYPGLDKEIVKIYRKLKSEVFNGINVFSYGTFDILDFFPNNGDQQYSITLNQSTNVGNIDFEEIADVAGGRDLLRSVLPENFNWGRIFDDGVYDEYRIQLGPSLAQEIPSHEGSINNSSWKVRAAGDAVNNTSRAADYFFDSTMGKDVTATQIVYKQGSEFKCESFIDKNAESLWLTPFTSENDIRFPLNKRNAFDYYLLVGWKGAFTKGPNLDNSQFGEEVWFNENNEVTFDQILSDKGELEASKILLTYYNEDAFLTLFYSWARQVADIGGGGDDERFQDQEDEDDRFDDVGEGDKEIATALEEFAASIERNKFNNKVNNWFYNIRQLHADSTYAFNITDPFTWTNPEGGKDDAIQLKDGTTIGSYRNDDGTVESYFNYQDIFTLDGENIVNLITSKGNPSGLAYSGLVEGANQGNLIKLVGERYNSNPTLTNPPGGIFVDPIGQCLNLSITSWRESVGFPQYNDPKTPIDFIKLDIQPIQDSYFIRLRVLLDFINNFLIPKKEGSGKVSPIIQIDIDTETNICYSIDNMISINPRKCLISNEKFCAGKTFSGVEKLEVIYGGLEKFHVVEEDYRYGQLMNIYFNFRRVEEMFSSVDKNNQVSLFTILKSICDDINESLGNVNNLEPIIDKDENLIKIIDQTTIPNIDKIRKALQGKGTIEENDYELKAKQTPLEVFGYNNVTNQSNFVRNVGITTEISKNYATSITIGATAQGEVPGMESTAFSRWNVGLKDRFKNNLIDGEKAGDTGSLEEQNKQVMENYETFLESGYNKLGLNKKDRDLAINDEFISTNRNVANSYYVYAQAQTTLANYDETTNEGIIESSIGFLPINLKLEMDGLGGIRIYDFVKVNSSFLPSNYPDTLEFICTGVNHKLEGNDWITNLKTIATYIDKGSKATSATS